MLPLRSTKILFTVWVLLTFALFGGYIYFLNLISSTNNALAQIEHELERELNKENTLRNLDFLMKETEEKRRILDSYSIDKDGVVGFINDLERYARETENESEITLVELKDLDPKHSMFELLRLTIVVRGSWNSVTNFIDEIHHLPLSIETTSFSIDRKKVGEVFDGWEGIVSLEILKKK